MWGGLKFLVLGFVVLPLAATALADECKPLGIPACDDEAKRPPPPGNLDDVTPLRRLIVETAASQIGLVSETQGADCFKRGWRSLLNYYETSWSGKLSSDDIAAIKRANTGTGKKVKVNDWCGIFAMWALKAAVRRNLDHEKDGRTCEFSPMGETEADIQQRRIMMATWTTRPEGLAFHAGAAGLKPGDIVYIKDPPPPAAQLNHHAIVERVVGGKVYTIDGNGQCQGIARHSVDSDMVRGYYSIE